MGSSTGSRLSSIQELSRPIIGQSERCGPRLVLRKILGTLRNDKGTAIHECIMTTPATGGQNGLDSLKMLTAKLAS
ncbi:Uncharacterised protein [uncultured archaeon]|nr:Uncharacterised protein [uncultured archaeon]